MPTSLRTLAAALLALAAPALGAQSFASRESAPAAATGLHGPRPAVGERATYEVRLAGRSVGSGSLEVIGQETIKGRPALRTALQVNASVLFAKVNDRFESWIDPQGLFSHRFVQDQHEIGRTRRKEYDFSLADKTFREANSGDVEPLSSQQPLDDVSFLFYVRTLPLRVGDVDTIPRYFKTGRDVIIRVLRKETVVVPAGRFETIVVQPTITNANGLFGQGGHAEVYFSDDSTRTLVMMKSRVPVLGSLSLHLREQSRAK